MPTVNRFYSHPMVLASGHGFTPPQSTSYSTQFDMPAKGRPPIILHPLDQPMFDGVKMDVINAPFEIVFVADRVFPRPALPDRSFALLDA